MERENLINLTDSYKDSQWCQYPADSAFVHSYFEQRLGAKWPSSIWFGPQIAFKRYLLQGVTKEDVNEERALAKLHYGTDEFFNYDGWMHIVNKHGGKLPLRIKSVPEGMLVPIDNVLMTVENTDDKCHWLTTHFETLLTEFSWYGSAVATSSFVQKAQIMEYLIKTGDPALIDFKLHDFGFRGTTCPEQAGIGGLAHLVNFKGTDTKIALTYGRRYYGEPCAGYSIPASEHSTITSWGGFEYEVDAFRNMIKKYGRYPLYACVSDSYDIQRACSVLWGQQLKDEVLEAPGTLVVRPDSGVPHKMVLDCLERLGAAFGYTYNGKGYKILHPKVRLIQGDGVDYEEENRIMHLMMVEKWSVDNIAFGSGGALLQKVNRDTQRSAFKASCLTTTSGHERDVFKNPKSDSTKTSKKGKLSLIMKNGKITTVRGAGKDGDFLKTSFLNGELVEDYDFTGVRARANEALNEVVKKAM